MQAAILCQPLKGLYKAGPFMSLSVHSPFLGQKRLLSDREDSPEQTNTSSPKRIRRFTASPSGRCPRREPTACRAPSHLTTLRTLFPQMDEKVVVEVLGSCGNNIDEAIKLLGALQLTQANSTESGLSKAAQEKLRDDSASNREHESHNASQTQNPDPEQQADEDRLTAKVRQKSPAEWVEGLVQQMSGARDMGDARVRAAQELRAFEQTVSHTTNKARQEEIHALQTRILELSKENALLKRAVTIQQSRLQEAEATNKNQTSQAESVISDLQGRVHALEMSNYSLSLHLRQATSAQNCTSSHPDVF